jgi:sugar phosphate isomerase/epimerase
MTLTWRVSAFADEVADDLGDQIEALKAEGVGGLDLRSLGGVNVLQLSDDLLREVRDRCAEAGLRVQCVGSPINKVALAEAGEEVARLGRAIEIAKLLGTDRIRIFTPRTAGQDAEADWEQVASLVGRMCAMAEDAGVVLVHENDADLFGAYPDNAKRLFDRFGGPNFRAVFDFANTVLLGYRPLDDWFPWIIPHLDTLHVKDAIRDEKRVVAAAEGEGQIREVLSLLREHGWQGTLTLEPHLQAAGPYGGYTGPELFAVAAGALRALVHEVGGIWA